MRVLDTPSHDALEVYQECVDSVACVGLQARLNEVKEEIAMAARDYREKALTANLFQITEFAGTDDDIVVGHVSNKELKNIYSGQMVGSKKSARKIYDELRMGSPLNICPFCGFGHVSTLDHYLPKSKYPCLSVLPLNLVPSCSDCNKGKSTSVAKNAGQQCIHPYFDHKLCSTGQWLFANVKDTIPVSVKYYVDPPNNWSLIDKARVEAHFSCFELSTRYTIQATNELATLKELLCYDFDINGGDGVRDELTKRTIAALSVHPNSWNAAMYQALAASDWYCQVGFRAE